MESQQLAIIEVRSHVCCDIFPFFFCVSVCVSVFFLKAWDGSLKTAVINSWAIVKVTPTCCVFFLLFCFVLYFFLVLGHVLLKSQLPVIMM